VGGGSVAGSVGNAGSATTAWVCGRDDLSFPEVSGDAVASSASSVMVWRRYI
jgi:hypothetical protein